jgi:hypothetical protein
MEATIPLPLVITLAWLLFNYVLLWLISNFQAKEELLDQAHVLRILVTGMRFSRKWLKIDAH